MKQMLCVHGSGDGTTGLQVPRDKLSSTHYIHNKSTKVHAEQGWGLDKDHDAVPAARPRPHIRGATRASLRWL